MPEVLPADTPAAVAFLEHFPETGEGAHRLLLDHFPFCIGRNASAHYCINSRHVSKEHAQIVRDGGVILIRDVGSTNGTFVNGQRIQRSGAQQRRHRSRRPQGISLRPGDAAVVQDAEAVNTDHASGPLPVSAIQNAEYLGECCGGRACGRCFSPSWTCGRASHGL